MAMKLFWFINADLRKAVTVTVKADGFLKAARIIADT